MSTTAPPRAENARDLGAERVDVGVRCAEELLRLVDREHVEPRIGSDQARQRGHTAGAGAHHLDRAPAAAKLGDDPGQQQR